MKRLMVKMLAAMVVLFVASPASAQATRTWVSGVGDDVNPCSRTAPCKTFAGAISKTATGGEIDCLDPGGFGTLTITKSITIDCSGTFGSTLASGTVGFNINDSASATPGTARVVLRGLSINGAGTTLGTEGVRIKSAREVLIVDSIISNFSTAAVTVGSTVKLRVTIANSQLFRNDVGVKMMATASTATVQLIDTVIANQVTAGVSVNSANNTAYLSNVQIAFAPKALDISGGGIIFSYGNNVLNATATDAPTPTPLQ